MSADRVAICCPGPSFSPEKVPEGFEVAAINQTLKSLDRCSWWVCYDCPNDVHDQCADAFLRLRPAIVTMEERVESWRHWFKARNLSHHEWPALEIVDWGPLWYKVAIKSGPRFSSLVAISWALRRRVKELHWIGADLGGDRYYDPETSGLLRNSHKSDRVWKNRWEGERKSMKASQDEAAKRGYTRLTGLPWEDPPELTAPAE